jgi:hypothetical protein
MMKKTIKYKSFKTSTEFEEWQANNTVDYHQIQPIVFGGKIKEDQEAEQANFNTEVGVFVLYSHTDQENTQ